MAPKVSKSKPLGDRNHGGALFILPPEIRDEIYRLLLKSHYTIPYSGPTKCHGRKNRDKKTVEPGLVIFRVSRIISYEAQELFYAESTFHFTVDFGTYMGRLECPTLKRVRKVKIMIRGLTSQLDGYDAMYTPAVYSHRIEAICRPTIDEFMGTKIRRDSCHIQFCDFGSPVVFPLTTYLLPKLAAFNGFNTVLVEVLTKENYEQVARKQRYHHGRDAGQRITRKLEGFGTMMTGMMERTMGPAISRDDGFTIRLEFKPREHAPSILRAQARKLLWEAERLEQGD